MRLPHILPFFKRDCSITIESPIFTAPDYRCSRWVLVRGPAYGDHHFIGSELVEASELKVWASHHAQVVMSTDESDQEARIFLPKWLGDADIADETVTLLTNKLRAVVKYYDSDFLNFSNTKVFCPECANYCAKVLVKWESKLVNKLDKWVGSWNCEVGHRLMYTELEPPRVTRLKV
jgi:hypothetical protein